MELASTLLELLPFQFYQSDTHYGWIYCGAGWVLLHISIITLYAQRQGKEERKLPLATDMNYHYLDALPL